MVTVNPWKLLAALRQISCLFWSNIGNVKYDLFRVFMNFYLYLQRNGTKKECWDCRNLLQLLLDTRDMELVLINEYSFHWRLCFSKLDRDKILQTKKFYRSILIVESGQPFFTLPIFVGLERARKANKAK